MEKVRKVWEASRECIKRDALDKNPTIEIGRSSMDMTLMNIEEIDWFIT